MFTRRAGVGSAEARRAGANGARIELGGSDWRAGAEARIEAKAGSAEARRCGSSYGEVHCHFISPAPLRHD